MEEMEYLNKKSILIVDEEQDVLDSFEDLLEMCSVQTARRFIEAKEFLLNNDYDAAIMDVYLINCIDLINIAKREFTPCLLLFSDYNPEGSLIKAVEYGADYLAPKFDMLEIYRYLCDMLTSVEKRGNPWVEWRRRLGTYFRRNIPGAHRDSDFDAYLSRQFAGESGRIFFS